MLHLADTLFALQRANSNWFDDASAMFQGAMQRRCPALQCVLRDVRGPLEARVRRVLDAGRQQVVRILRDEAVADGEQVSASMQGVLCGALVRRLPCDAAGVPGDSAVRHVPQPRLVVP